MNTPVRWMKGVVPALLWALNLMRLCWSCAEVCPGGLILKQENQMEG